MSEQGLTKRIAEVCTEGFTPSTEAAWRYQDVYLSSDVDAAIAQAKREVWLEAWKECWRLIEIIDAKVEGCDGPQFLEYNARILALVEFGSWCRQQAKEVKP